MDYEVMIPSDKEVKLLFLLYVDDFILFCGFGNWRKTLSLFRPTSSYPCCEDTDHGAFNQNIKLLFNYKNNQLIDKKEILLLDYISEYESPIFFFWRKDVGELFNKPCHNLGLDDLARNISKLWMKGLIQIEINDVIIEWQSLEKIVWWLTHEHILQNNVEECPIVMLTDSGGELWENAFKPNWEMFMTTQEEIIEKGLNILGSENLIIASDKQRIIDLIDQIENKFKNLSLKNKILEIKPFFPVYW